MLRTLTIGIAAAALALPALADCAGDEADLRAKAAEVAELNTKIEAHRELVQTASGNFKNAATDEDKAKYDEELSTVETELDDLKGARGSALYDILDISAAYGKSCKTPAQPLLDELGIKAEDLPEY